MKPLFVVLVLLLASTPRLAAAFETTLRLDESSLLRPRDAVGAGGYAFGAGARVRMRFAPQGSNAFAVEVPADGLELGVVRGAGLPPLELRLASPVSGTLRKTASGEGTLELHGDVVVRRVGGRRPMVYTLAFTADLIRIGATGKGYLQLSVDRPDPADIQRFDVLIAGQLDTLPPGF